jgi:NAD(P)-dependent dehydrogenase (short-subunit alcohol dehydrogenase family)
MAIEKVRVAVVTGAAQGMGRAIAQRLCADGLDLAINDLKAGPQLDSLKAEVEAKGRKCVIVPADISQEEQVKGLIDVVVKELGGIDVVSQ